MEKISICPLKLSALIFRVGASVNPEARNVQDCTMCDPSCAWALDTESKDKDRPVCGLITQSN